MKDKSADKNSEQILRDAKDSKKATASLSDDDTPPVNEEAFKNRFDIIDPKPTKDGSLKRTSKADSSSYKKQMLSGNDASEARVTSDNYQKVYTKKVEKMKELTEIRLAVEAAITEAKKNL